MGAIDFERCALGAVLVNPANWELIALLRPEDFLLDSHCKIFSRMRDLAESNRPLELITLVNELDCQRELQSAGDVGYIASLMDGLPDRPLDSVQHYVNEVRRFAVLRRIVYGTESIRVKAANDPTATVTDLRLQLLEVERDAARADVLPGTRVTKISEIPDPFSVAPDEISWVVEGLIPAGGYHHHRRRGWSREDVDGFGACPSFDVGRRFSRSKNASCPSALSRQGESLETHARAAPNPIGRSIPLSAVGVVVPRCAADDWRSAVAGFRSDGAGADLRFHDQVPYRGREFRYSDGTGYGLSPRVSNCWRKHRGTASQAEERDLVLSGKQRHRGWCRCRLFLSKARWGVRVEDHQESLHAGDDHYGP